MLDGVFVTNQGTLECDCSVYNAVSNNICGTSDSVIDDEINVAITTLNILDDSPIIIKKGEIRSTFTTYRRRN